MNINRIFSFILIPLLFLPEGLAAQEDFSPDRPGMSTGPGVMAAGKVMWETGFEGSYDEGWGILMPTTMFRVGVSDFAEVRLEYDGSLVQNGRKWGYEVDPLVLGTKLKICDGRKWIPSISFMANLAIPCTKKLCGEMSVAPSLMLLFQNDVCNWFNIGYNVGAVWNGKAAAPDTFLALCLNFNPVDRLGLFVESYNYLVPVDGGRLRGVCNLDAGLSVMVTPRLQLDWYAGMNLNNPSSQFLTGLGVAWMIN